MSSNLPKDFLRYVLGMRQEIKELFQAVGTKHQGAHMSEW